MWKPFCDSDKKGSVPVTNLLSMLEKEVTDQKVQDISWHIIKRKKDKGFIQCILNAVDSKLKQIDGMTWVHKVVY